MRTTIYMQRRREEFPVLFALKTLATTSLVFLALSLGTPFAQRAVFAQTPPPAREFHLDSNGVSRLEAFATLTLQNALDLALEGNLELAVARREIEATEGQVLQGRSRPNPALVYTLEDLRTQTRSQSLQINLPVERGGKRAARIAIAERGRDIAIEEFNIRRFELCAAVAAAFFEALAAQERTSLAHASVDLAKRASDAVGKRVMAGKVSPVEETKSRVAEAGVRVELAQAQSEQRSARIRLTSFLGALAPRFTLVVGRMDDLPSIPTLDNIQQRLSASPTLQRAQQEIERRRLIVALEQSKRTPDITLSVGVRHPNELQRSQVLFGIAVPLPVFDRNQGNLLEALRREDKARDELKALNARINSEVMQARERLESIRGEVDVLLREVLPGAKSAYDAATIGFENGKFSFLEVLDAQRTYFAAKSQTLKVQAEAHRAAADIDRVLGEALASDIAPVAKE